MKKENSHKTLSDPIITSFSERKERPWGHSEDLYEEHQRLQDKSGRFSDIKPGHIELHEAGDLVPEIPATSASWCTAEPKH